MTKPIFPGVRPPSVDFQAVRDQRRSRPFYVQVALDVARSIANGVAEDASDVSGKALKLNIAGNAWWSDPIYDSGGNYIAGIAVAHFEDSALGSGISTPITILPNSSQRIPFTSVILENFAQVGKKARIVYGVDIDFVPGFNAQATIGGTVNVLEQGYAYGTAFVSTTNLVAGTPETIFAAGSNVNGAAIARVSQLLLGATVPTSAYIARAAAPANIRQNDVLGYSSGSGIANSSYLQIEGRLRITSGKGLHRIADVTETTTSSTALYSLL